MGSLLEKLDGFKTYLAIILSCVWSVLYIKKMLPVSDDNFQMVLAGLLAATGLSMRHGVAKAEAATPPEADKK